MDANRLGVQILVGCGLVALILFPALVQSCSARNGEQQAQPSPPPSAEPVSNILTAGH